MPEYHFICEKCSDISVEYWPIAEYDEQIKKAKCQNCSSKKTRAYEYDTVNTFVVAGLSDCKTIGQYAEKQTKKYGKEKCEDMRRKFVEYKENKEGGMEKLPDGMSRIKSSSDLNNQPKSNRKSKKKKKGS